MHKNILYRLVMNKICLNQNYCTKALSLSFCRSTSLCAFDFERDDCGAVLPLVPGMFADPPAPPLIPVLSPPPPPLLLSTTHKYEALTKMLLSTASLRE